MFFCSTLRVTRMLFQRGYDMFSSKPLLQSVDVSEGSSTGGSSLKCGAFSILWSTYPVGQSFSRDHLLISQAFHRLMNIVSTSCIALSYSNLDPLSLSAFFSLLFFLPGSDLCRPIPPWREVDPLLTQQALPINDKHQRG